MNDSTSPFREHAISMPQGADERSSANKISAIDLLKEGLRNLNGINDNNLAVTPDGKLINSSFSLTDTTSKWAPLSKAGFNKEEASIAQGGFNLPIVEGLKPEKGILTSIKEQITGRPLDECFAEKFGNTVEGKIKQSVALSKMTPEEQAVLLRDEGIDQKARVYMNRQDLERDAKVFEKFNKLVDQEKAKHVDGALASMSPAERAALKQEMRQMKNNATIDFQTGKVELPQPGPNVQLFYERLAQNVLRPTAQSTKAQKS